MDDHGCEFFSVFRASGVVKCLGFQGDGPCTGSETMRRLSRCVQMPSARAKAAAPAAAAAAAAATTTTTATAATATAKLLNC